MHINFPQISALIQLILVNMCKSVLISFTCDENWIISYQRVLSTSCFRAIFIRDLIISRCISKNEKLRLLLFWTVHFVVTMRGLEENCPETKLLAKLSPRANIKSIWTYNNILECDKHVAQKPYWFRVVDLDVPNLIGDARVWWLETETN